MSDLRILDMVNTPADLKALTNEELSILACEIREDIVEKRLPWPRPGTLGKLSSAAGPYKKGPPFS